MVKEPEQKTAMLSVRVRPSIKAMIERFAEADRRSVASTLELILEAETERRKARKP
jgi:hypothetical protein